MRMRNKRNPMRMRNTQKLLSARSGGFWGKPELGDLAILANFLDGIFFALRD